MGKTVLHLDFETRSEIDLLRHGAFVYAAHPSTTVLCLGWAFGHAPVEVWVPGEPFPDAIRAHFAAGNRASIHAHNAQFEILITEHVLSRMVPGLPIPPLAAWYCTAAQARARALPGGLDDLGLCLGLNTRKDRRGKELIKLLSMPQRDPETGGTYWNDDPDLLAEMVAYCRQDVVVERAAGAVTPPLTEAEHGDWLIAEAVNRRGMKVDVPFAEAAVRYADAELAEITTELATVTGGAITSPRQYQRIKAFLAPHMERDDRIRKAMTVVRTDRRTGTETRKITLDRDARAKLTALAELEPGLLPDDVLDVIALTDEAGRSSVAKYSAMTARADADGRVRGAYLYAGAGQTLRFSSAGLQLHNFPRTCAEDPDRIRDVVLRHGALDGVMDTLSSMLRPSIIADDGHVLVWGDWSAIEARILPWLAGGPGDGVLDVFRANDADPSRPDIYMVEAGSVYGIDPAAVDDAQRQVGKVVVLSAGYGGGHRAFQAMARAYRVVLSDEDAARIIQTWRTNNPWAPRLWRDLERAAVAAVRSPGSETRAGRMTYCKPTPAAPLYCLLPSGTILSYPDARVDEVDTEYGIKPVLTAIKAAWKPAKGETDWGRVTLYGGLLAENCTQATAACILRHALKVCAEDGWPVVGHVHDEIVIEVREDEEADARQALAGAMLDVPAWAAGLPMKAATKSGRRYGK